MTDYSYYDYNIRQTNTSRTTTGTTNTTGTTTTAAGTTTSPSSGTVTSPILKTNQENKLKTDTFQRTGSTPVTDTPAVSGTQKITSEAVQQDITAAGQNSGAQRQQDEITKLKNASQNYQNSAAAAKENTGTNTAASTSASASTVPVSTAATNTRSSAVSEKYAYMDKGTTITGHDKDGNETGYSKIRGQNVNFTTKTNSGVDGTFQERTYDDGSSRVYQNGRMIRENGNQVKVDEATGNYTASHPIYNRNTAVYDKSGNYVNDDSNGQTAVTKNGLYKYNRNEGYVRNFNDGTDTKTLSAQTNKNTDANGLAINGELDSAHGQRAMGSCFFDSQLNAVSGTTWGKNAIKNSITNNNDGTYNVNFDGTKESYNISSSEIQGAKTKTTADGRPYFTQGEDDFTTLQLGFERSANNSGFFNTGESTPQIKNTKGETVKDPSGIANGGFVGSGRYDYQSIDVAYTLTGNKTHAIGNLRENSQQTDELLSLKADNPDDVAMTISQGTRTEQQEKHLKEKYGKHDYSKYGKGKHDGYSYNYTPLHTYEVRGVDKDDKGNISNVRVTNPWDSGNEINVKYEDFKKDWATNEDDMSFAVDRNNTGLSAQTRKIEQEATANFVNNTKKQKYSGETYERFAKDVSTSREGIIKEYGGVENVMKDVTKNARNEYNALKRKDKSFNMSFEEYQNGIKTAFLRDSGLVPGCTNPDDLELYCNQLGIQY